MSLRITLKTPMITGIVRAAVALVHALHHLQQIKPWIMQIHSPVLRMNCIQYNINGINVYRIITIFNCKRIGQNVTGKEHIQQYF